MNCSSSKISTLRLEIGDKCVVRSRPYSERAWDIREILYRILVGDDPFWSDLCTRMRKNERYRTSQGVIDLLMNIGYFVWTTSHAVDYQEARTINISAFRDELRPCCGSRRFRQESAFSLWTAIGSNRRLCDDSKSCIVMNHTNSVAQTLESDQSLKKEVGTSNKLLRWGCRLSDLSISKSKLVGLYRLLAPYGNKPRAIQDCTISA